MTILKTSILAAAVALIAVSSANAQGKKYVLQGQEYTTVQAPLPTSRAAQESLTW